MAKIDLKFIDDLSDDDFIKVKMSDRNYKRKELIEITGFQTGLKDGNFSIFLDKSTAIKFAKTLRTEINKI